MSDPVQKGPKRPRGRPRAYDPDQALVRATTAFWQRGYAATSLDDLTAATGMNRPSLYGAFGDKRELYLASLDRYVELSSAGIAAALGDAPLAEGLQRVYDGALALYFAESPAVGCFLIGTAATEAPRDAAVRRKLGSGLRAFTRLIEARIQRARDAGEIAADTDPALLAEMAGAVLHSIALRARAGDTRTSLRAFSRASVELLCASASARSARAASRRRAKAARR